MGKIIKLIITIIIACSINGLDNAFKNELPFFEEDSVSNTLIENVQEAKNVEEKSDLSNEQIIEDNEIISSSDTEEKEKIESTSSTSENKEVKQQVESKVEVQEEKPKVKEEAIKVQPSNEVKQEQNIVQEPKIEPPKNNPWDSLGITEYDYYNKPAHSWAELDFKISSYGSREATLNACKEYGNNYISQNGGGYFCDSVNSYSGNYLGEDIDFY